MARARKPKAKKKSPTGKPAPKPAKKTGTPNAKLSPKIRKQLSAAEKQRQKNLRGRARREAQTKAQARREKINKKIKRTKTLKAKAKARQLATRAKPGTGLSLYATLENLLYEMASTRSPEPLTALVIRGPVLDEGREPWLIGAHFTSEAALDWTKVGRILVAWQNDLILETTVNPQRYSYIRFLFQEYDENGDPKGGIQGVSASSPTAWEAMLSRSISKVIGSDPDDPDDESMAVMYEGAAVLEIQVSWSASMA